MMIHSYSQLRGRIVFTLSIKAPLYRIYIHYIIANRQEQVPPVCFVWESIQRLHHLAATAGDHLAGLHMEEFVADGAIHVAFFFRPDYRAQAAFQFHNVLLEKGRAQAGALRVFFEVALRPQFVEIIINVL